MNLELDLHVHTLASGHAYSTIHDYLVIAKERGLKMIGFSDHGPAMPGGPNLFHIANQIVIPREIEGIVVLRGVEANIIDYDGNIDIPDVYLNRLDYVIASLHEVTLKSKDMLTNTNTVIKAIESGKIHILGHLGNPAYDLDYSSILDSCLTHDVIVEINNSSFTSTSRMGSKEKCFELAEMANSKGVKLIAGSDSHVSFSIGGFEHCIDLFNKLSIKEELIMNISKDRFVEYLESKGKCILI